MPDLPDFTTDRALSRGLSPPQVNYYNFWWRADIPSGYDWSVVTHTNDRQGIVEHVVLVFSQSNYAGLQCVEILLNNSRIFVGSSVERGIAFTPHIADAPMLTYGDSLTVRTWKPSDATYQVYGCLTCYRELV